MVVRWDEILAADSVALMVASTVERRAATMARRKDELLVDTKVEEMVGWKAGLLVVRWDNILAAYSVISKVASMVGRKVSAMAMRKVEL